MRVLVTGGAGLLGGELLRRAPAWASTEATVFHRPVSAADVRTHVVDLAQRQAFFEVAERRRPDLVIHTAYSKTDHRATVDAATEVATVCAALDVALVHISSDAVFDGDHAPYSEHDEPAPVHAYGRAKHAAETAVVTAVPAATVVRTSLILAADGTDQTSAWAIERLQAGEPVTFFDDEFRMPIFVDDLAEQIWEVASRDAAARSGVWHLVGPERLSRAQVGDVLCGRFGLDPSLVEVASAATMGEPRPRDLSLRSDRAGSLTTQARSITTVSRHGTS
ncbi:MAG: sugar nucleotide-binding protein [Microthrixaceae bacterium]|nr:sugar nucleotide-binding protein [Microthrixaceae bacterium]